MARGEPARRFGDFDLLEAIGSGGFGTVWKAREVVLGRIVALKMLKAELSDDPDWVRRFHREARIAASLDHPAIPAIYRFGEVDGVHYIAMRYIDGITLARLAVDKGPMTIDDVRMFLEPIGDALDLAHGALIIHGDIKPGNIMVERSGRSWLMDFGLARPLVRSSASILVPQSVMGLVGTFPYISPEQFRNESSGPASDRYAIGVTAYELLTGELPFDGISDAALMFKVVSDPPPQCVNFGQTFLSKSSVRCPGCLRRSREIGFLRPLSSSESLPGRTAWRGFPTRTWSRDPFLMSPICLRQCVSRSYKSCHHRDRVLVSGSPKGS